MTWRLASILPIWVLALAGAVVVAIVATADALIWIPVAMSACVVLALVIQIPVGRREGLVGRLSASIGGSFAILVLATLILIVAVPANLRLA